MITGYALEQLLPHDHPMILLSRFSHAHSDSVLCAVDISEQSPFYRSELGGVPAYVGLEYMAQTVACYAGALALSKAEPIKIGFLLGSRKYQPTVTVFHAGSTLEISAHKLVMENSGLSVFSCEITADGVVLVQANLNVFQPENHLDWIKES
jgi:predicted hotdog family 3-hydroxylacyl-ACP dehydratase